MRSITRENPDDGNGQCLPVHFGDAGPARRRSRRLRKFDRIQFASVRGADFGKMLLMTNDDRNLNERAESLMGKIYGEPTSIDQVADDFALYGLKKRAATLEDIDSELRDEIDSSAHSLRRRVQLMGLRRKMGGLHEALRKAKR